MKKIFTIILVAAGLLSFNAASAQNRDYGYNNQGNYPVYQQNDNWNNNQRRESRDYGYNNRRGRNNDYERQRQYEYERQRQMEYERQRQVQYERQRQMEYERQRQAECDR